MHAYSTVNAMFQEMPDNSQITITVIIINIIVIVIAIRVINATQHSMRGMKFPIRQTKSQIIRHREKW